MTGRSVLISGAGVAGPVLAYWLARAGFVPTVVERSAAPRSSGAPVDVRGPAVEVAERMGVMARIRDAGTAVTRLSFVDGGGRRLATVDMGAIQRAAGGGDVELPRGDLAAILREAGRDHAEYLFDDAVAALSQDKGGVDVVFEQGASRRFDLVIGADGLHSGVRRLAFGPEAGFVSHMGLYIATLALDEGVERADEVTIYNTPGRAVTVHPGQGRALAAFIFHAPAMPFNHRNLAQHKGLLAMACAGAGWRTPELIGRVQAAPDLYFDAVSRVSLDSWRRGRVALVGDAASCVSLFGDGSTLAMAGAFTLARELAASPDDHRGAFHRYEEKHRALAGPLQRGVRQGAFALAPRTRAGIAMRNAAAGLWPLAAAGARLGRLASGRRRPSLPSHEQCS